MRETELADSWVGVARELSPGVGGRQVFWHAHPVYRTELVDGRLRLLFAAACNRFPELVTREAVIAIAELIADRGDSHYPYDNPIGSHPTHPNLFHPFALTKKLRARKVHADILVRMIRPEWEFDKNWLTSDVSGLAVGIYEGEAWDRTPILADALEEAGCSDFRILGHLRGGDLWFRGEWVVDHCGGKRS